jgi:hypothetical protein
VNPPTLFQPHASPIPVPKDTHDPGQVARPPDPASNDYIAVMEVDQAGSCTVVHANTPMHPFFVLKKRKIDHEHESRLVKTEHQNVVNLESFLQHNDFHALIYEFCSVSLSDVLCSLAPSLEEFHLSAVAKQVTCLDLERKIVD